MKKHFLAGGAAAVMALTTVGTGLASAASQQLPGSNGTEGCAVATYEAGQSCSYKPTVPGGAIFTPGAEMITVSGVVHNADGTTSPYTVSFNPNGSQENCVLWTPAASGARYTNVTNVTLTTETLTDVAVIGQPYPSGSPEQLGPAC